MVFGLWVMGVGFLDFQAKAGGGKRPLVGKRKAVPGLASGTA
jgi:hypothetical protein